MSMRLRTTVALTLCTAAIGLGLVVWQWQQQRQQAQWQLSVARGRALFNGDGGEGDVLRGRLRNHKRFLSATATRCSNCHVKGEAAKDAGPDPSAANSPSGTALSAQTNRFGPALNAAYLQNNLSRRGGPPSAYTPQSLCELLRSGTNPVSILINTSMPHYRISASQCRDLWAYLLQSES